MKTEINSKQKKEKKKKKRSEARAMSLESTEKTARRKTRCHQICKGNKKKNISFLATPTPPNLQRRRRPSKKEKIAPQKVRHARMHLQSGVLISSENGSIGLPPPHLTLPTKKKRGQNDSNRESQ
jgi:hypothetical protein